MGIDRIESRLVVEEVARERRAQSAVREPVQRKVSSPPIAEISSVTQRGPIGRWIDKVVGRPQRVEVQIKDPRTSAQILFDRAKAADEAVALDTARADHKVHNLRATFRTERSGEQTEFSKRLVQRLHDAHGAYLARPSDSTKAEVIAALKAVEKAKALTPTELTFMRTVLDRPIAKDIDHPVPNNIKLVGHVSPDESDGATILSIATGKQIYPKLDSSQPKPFLQEQIEISQVSEAQARGTLAAQEADRLEKAYDAYFEHPTAINAAHAISALGSATLIGALDHEELEMVAASLHHRIEEPKIWPEGLFEPLVGDDELSQVSWPNSALTSPIEFEAELKRATEALRNSLSEQLDLERKEIIEAPSDVLRDLGITPVYEEAPYADIFIVYHYRDVTCLIDGDRRLGEAVDMAFTRRGAFCALVRMAQAQYRHSVSFDRLEDFGLTPDDPQLEELCQVLNQLTGDTFDASPYETSIDTKFLGFLQ